MNNKENLEEKKYEKTKRKITITAAIILIIGLLTGGYLIFLGIRNSINTNNTYSEKNRQESINKLNEQISSQKNILETKKKELQSKGITASKKYDSGDAYDLYIIDNVLNPTFSHCSFNEYNNNSLTSKYCSLKIELEKIQRMNVNFEKEMENSKNIPLYMFGGFIIITMSIISGIVSKRREITSFALQQMMAEDSMEKMANSMSKVSGNIAKEISKGIEEGKAEAKVQHVVRCPRCGADNEIIGRTGQCEYCKSKIEYDK